MSVGSDLTEAFLEEGFVRLPAAVPRSLARQCERLLWEETGYDSNDPQTWAGPVHWVLHRDDPPFVQAINSPALAQAFDVLVGPGRCSPRTASAHSPSTSRTQTHRTTTGGTSTRRSPTRDSPTPTR